jgi:hypothetical protein
MRVARRTPRKPHRRGGGSAGAGFSPGGAATGENATSSGAGLCRSGKPSPKPMSTEQWRAQVAHPAPGTPWPGCSAWSSWSPPPAWSPCAARSTCPLDTGIAMPLHGCPPAPKAHLNGSNASTTHARTRSAVRTASLVTLSRVARPAMPRIHPGAASRFTIRSTVRIAAPAADAKGRTTADLSAPACSSTAPAGSRDRRAWA